MSLFKINGMYKSGNVTKLWQPFSKTVESHSEKNAIERVYSLMGSQHGVKRNLVKIEGVKSSEQ
jgi:large subunit ribosomal protein LX